MTSFGIAADVAWVSSEELDLDGQPTAYVTTMPHGPATVLEGSACIIWLSLVDGGTVDDVVERVLDLGGFTAGQVARAAVAADTLTVIQGLVDAGIVVEM